MVFESIPTLDDDDFFKLLIESPQDVGIVGVSDFIKSDEITNGYYFYITYVLCKTGQEKKISYNFKENKEGSVIIGEGAKLYPILSYISGIKHGDIRCMKEDISEGLKGDITFKASASKQKGKKSWWKIIPITNGGE